MRDGKEHSSLPIRAGKHPAASSGTLPAASASATAKLRLLISSLPEESHTTLLTTKVQNGKDVLREASKRQETIKNPRAFQIISKAVYCLDPFFAAVDTVCQVDPAHFGVAWAGIRIIVQLLQDFSSFHEKLIRSLETVAEQISFFTNINGQLLRGQSGEIKDILDNVYEELVLYVIGVIRLFYARDGGKRSTTRILGKTTWKPFRMKNMIKSLRYLRRRLEDEIQLIQRGQGKRPDQEGATTERRVLDESLHTFGMTARAWLASSAFDDTCDHALRQRAPGTSEWFTKSTAFTTWYHQCKMRQSSSEDGEMAVKQPEIWIYGKPGAGKTVLAASLVSELQHDLGENSQSLVCYFFFDSLLQKSTAVVDAYRAILAQVLQRNLENQLLMDLFAFAMWSDSNGKLTASPRELSELFGLCLRILSDVNVYLIIDGLDECKSKDLDILLSSPPNSPLLNRIFFSRKSMTSTARLELNMDQHNLDDIRQYLIIQLEDMTTRDILPRYLDTNVLGSFFATKAKGLFLWARLLIQLVNSPELSVSERLEALEQAKMAEDLDKMYAVVLAILGGPPVRAAIVKSILGWVLQSLRPLTVRELEEAVLHRISHERAFHAEHLTNSEVNITAICGGLVESESCSSTSDQPGGEYVKFIHSSVKEYLRGFEQPNLGTGFPAKPSPVPTPSWANCIIASTCLEYLTYTMPAEPLTNIWDTKHCQSNIKKAFPLAEYAVALWPDHCLAYCASRNRNSRRETDDASVQLVTALTKFLGQPKVINSWIEATYIFKGHLPSDKIARIDFENGLPFFDCIPYIELINKFNKYLGHVDRVWQTHLVKDPVCIWEEVGVFQSSVFNESLPGISVTQLSATAPLGDEHWPIPINRVSRLISGEAMHMVLSVFATRDFMECYSQPHRHSELFTSLRYCTGWRLRAEMANNDKPGERWNVNVTLDPTEVVSQLYQTLHLGSLQFPLSISPSGTHFSVLRTLYTLVWQHRQGLTGRCLASVLPLHLNSDMQAFWSVPHGQDFSSCFRIDEYFRLQRPENLGRVYLYWIYFDKRGQDMIVVEQAKSFPIAVSVFQLAKTTGQSQKADPTQLWRRYMPFKPQSRVESLEPTRQLAGKLFELAIHPTLPVFACTTAAGIFVCNYSTPTCVFQRVHEKGVMQPRKFVFSRDGESLYIQDQSSNPLVIVVAGYLQSDRTVSDHDPQQDQPSLASKTPDSNDKSKAALPAAKQPNTNGERALLWNDYVQSPTGDLVATVKNHDQKAQLNISKGGASEALLLARIPDIAGADTFEPSVILPRGGDDESHVTVVLDKSASTWNSLARVGSPGTKDDISLPLVIKRDLSTFPHASQAGMQLLSRNIMPVMEGKQLEHIESSGDENSWEVVDRGDDSEWEIQD